MTHEVVDVGLRLGGRNLVVEVDNQQLVRTRLRTEELAQHLDELGEVLILQPVAFGLVVQVKAVEVVAQHAACQVEGIGLDAGVVLLESGPLDAADAAHDEARTLLLAHLLQLAVGVGHVALVEVARLDVFGVVRRDARPEADDVHAVWQTREVETHRGRRVGGVAGIPSEADGVVRLLVFTQVAVVLAAVAVRYLYLRLFDVRASDGSQSHQAG